MDWLDAHMLLFKASNRFLPTSIKSRYVSTKEDTIYKNYKKSAQARFMPSQLLILQQKQRNSWVCFKV